MTSTKVRDRPPMIGIIFLFPIQGISGGPYGSRGESCVNLKVGLIDTTKVAKPSLVTVNCNGSVQFYFFSHSQFSCVQVVSNTLVGQRGAQTPM